MKIIYLTPETRLNAPSEVTVGFFDGFHQGHQHLVDTLISSASANQREPIVVTFDQDPLHVVNPQREPRHLSSLPMRLKWFAQFGVSMCVVLPFTAEMAQLTAREFLVDILQRQLSAKRLLLGYDNRFGRRTNESTNDFIDFAQNHGVEVIENEELLGPYGQLSSTTIRRLVADRQLTAAAEYLSRPHSIEGTVVHGVQEGRRMGYPTANIQLSDETLLLPPDGVYIVEVVIDELSPSFFGMMNIGHRPTFGKHEQTLEVHLLDFQGNLYGHGLEVMFHAFLREEQTFDSEAALAAQLKRDEESVRQYFANTDLY